MDIDKVRTSAGHPQTNATAEVFNKAIIKYISVMMENPGDDWTAWLPALTLCYNTAVHEATKSSPFFLTYGQDPNLPNFDLIQRPLYGENFAADRMSRLVIARRLAKENMEIAAAKMKNYHDKQAKVITYAVGEKCLLYSPRTCFTGNTKFAKLWTTVYINKVLGPTTYVCKFPDRPRARPTTVHADRLRKYWPREFVMTQHKPSFYSSSAKLNNAAHSDDDRNERRNEAVGQWSNIVKQSPSTPGSPPPPVTAPDSPRRTHWREPKREVSSEEEEEEEEEESGEDETVLPTSPLPPARGEYAYFTPDTDPGPRREVSKEPVPFELPDPFYEIGKRSRDDNSEEEEESEPKRPTGPSGLQRFAQGVYGSSNTGPRTRSEGPVPDYPLPDRPLEWKPKEK